jgi:hypothetical protein
MAGHQRSIPVSEFLSPTQARAVVNRFLLSRVGSVFAAGTPELDASTQLWRVPILYNPPDFVADTVGEVQVSAITGDIQQHTPIAELHRRATGLHDRHQAQIHAAFLRARKKQLLSAGVPADGAGCVWPKAIGARVATANGLARTARHL